MRYWDASALVPLVVKEEGTDLVRDWLEGDAHIATWGFTRVEIAGAIERRARQHIVDNRQRRTLLSRFEALAASWDEVTDLLAVRVRAIPLLARHSLRAADAAQLAAAALLAEGQPQSLDFVCLDRTLADAAEREGFRVLSWPDD